MNAFAAGQLLDIDDTEVGLSIANVAASSHSCDLNRRRCAVRRSPARPAGGAGRSTRAPSPTLPGHPRAAGRPFSRCSCHPTTRDIARFVREAKIISRYN